MSGNIERHALWHKVFDVEIPHPLLVIAGAGADMPHPGLRPALKRVVKAVEAICRLADQGARHLAVRAQHLQLHRLVGERFAVAVAQQAVEDHRFARAVEIPRTKHKELFSEAWRAGDGKLRQIQRRKSEIQQRGLPVLAGKEQRRLFVGLQRRVAVSVTGGLRQRLPFIVKELHFDCRLRRTVLQALGKDIQPVMVAVCGKTNIAEGKQGGGVTVVVMSGLIHHRDIDARLL